MGNGALERRPFGPVSRIEIRQNSSPNLVSNEVVINVPRHVEIIRVEAQLPGNIEAYDLDGGLEALTPIGDIHADRIGGYVSADAGTGRISLGKIGGLVQCSTGAGSITLENAVSGVKHCQTGGGELWVKEAGAQIGRAHV